MKVKLLKDIEFPYLAGKISILKGNEFLVRDVNIFGKPCYQVTDGKYKSLFIQADACELLDDKMYSEKEWNDMENHYLVLLDKEREKNDRLIQAVSSLTKSIVNNREVSQKLDSFLLTMNARDLWRKNG